jgi:predicted RNA-binding protein
MCLLKVYLEKGGSRRLIAEDVALVVREGSGIKLRSLELMDAVSLEEVDISLIDTLNSVMILKPKTEEVVS